MPVDAVSPEFDVEFVGTETVSVAQLRNLASVLPPSLPSFLTLIAVSKMRSLRVRRMLEDQTEDEEQCESSSEDL